MRQQITACLRVSPVSRLGGLRPSTVRALSGARRPQRREMLGPPSFLQPGHGARDIGTISGGGDRISMHDAADKIERSMAVFCKHIKRFADRNSELIGSPSSTHTSSRGSISSGHIVQDGRAPHCGGASFLDHFDWRLATSIASLRTAS